MKSYEIKELLEHTIWTAIITVPIHYLFSWTWIDGLVAGSMAAGYLWREIAQNEYKLIAQLRDEQRKRLGLHARPSNIGREQLGTMAGLFAPWDRDSLFDAFGPSVFILTMYGASYLYL